MIRLPISASLIYLCPSDFFLHPVPWNSVKTTSASPWSLPNSSSPFPSSYPWTPTIDHLIPFCIWRNWGSERIGNLLVTQLVSSWRRIWTHSLGHYKSYHHLCRNIVFQQCTWQRFCSTFCGSSAGLPEIQPSEDRHWLGLMWRIGGMCHLIFNKGFPRIEAGMW